MLSCAWHENNVPAVPVPWCSLIFAGTSPASPMFLDQLFAVQQLVQRPAGSRSLVVGAGPHQQHHVNKQPGVFVAAWLHVSAYYSFKCTTTTPEKNSRARTAHPARLSLPDTYCSAQPGPDSPVPQPRRVVDHCLVTCCDEGGKLPQCGERASAAYPGAGSCSTTRSSQRMHRRTQRRQCLQSSSLLH